MKGSCGSTVVCTAWAGTSTDAQPREFDGFGRFCASVAPPSGENSAAAPASVWPLAAVAIDVAPRARSVRAGLGYRRLGGVQIMALNSQAFGGSRVCPAMARVGLELNSSQREMAAFFRQGPASLSRLASPSASATPKISSLTEYSAEVLRKVELMQAVPISIFARGKTRSWARDDIGNEGAGRGCRRFCAACQGCGLRSSAVSASQAPKPLRHQSARCTPNRNNGAPPQ